jgi:dTDP-4-dehydrorhamnose reductase
VYALNARFPQELARHCERADVRLLHVSTDYVFDGAQAEAPYLESDEPNPLSWYAQTKYLGECTVLEANPSACIARIEMPFTARRARKSDFARLVEQRLRAKEGVVAVDDQRITPVLLEDAVAAMVELLVHGWRGIVHVASSTWTTPFDYARGVARRLHLDEGLVRRQRFAEFAGTRPATRPQHSWLDVSLFRQQCTTDMLRSVDEELDAWAQARHGNSIGGTQSATTLESRWIRTSSR